MKMSPMGCMKQSSGNNAAGSHDEISIAFAQRREALLRSTELGDGHWVVEVFAEARRGGTMISRGTPRIS